MNRKVEISQKTIVFTVGFLILLWFLFFIRDILLLLFVSILITVILNPTVKKLKAKKIPKGLSVLIVYFGAIALFVFGFAGILPPVVEQTTSFVSNIDIYLKQIGISDFVLTQLNTYLLSQVGSLPNQVVQLTVNLFSNILEIITVLIFAFYLLVTRDKLDEQIAAFLGHDNSKKIGNFLDRLEIDLGGWARAQLVLMLLIGVSSYLGLTLLGAPYALPLALLAGILEVVPYVGPIIGAIPAVIIGFGVSPVLGVAIIALYFLIQQVEAYVFVPKILEKSVGVNPVVTLLAIAVGFRMAGITGIFISVPVLIVLRILYTQFVRKPTTL